MNKKRYYCVVGSTPDNLLTIQNSILIIEKVESQGWDVAHILFAGAVPVRPKVLTAGTPDAMMAVPIYNIVLVKWGDANKRPSLPDINLRDSIPPTEMPQKAADDTGVKQVLDGRT